MTPLEQKGMAASAAWAQLTGHVAQHPGEAVPMPLLRSAVEKQADYTIAAQLDMIAHLAAGQVHKYFAAAITEAERDSLNDPA